MTAKGSDVKHTPKIEPDSGWTVYEEIDRIVTTIDLLGEKEIKTFFPVAWFKFKEDAKAWKKQSPGKYTLNSGLPEVLS